MSRTVRILGFVPLMVLGIMVATATPVRSETLLRWKFKPGETLRYVSQMKTTGKTGVGPTPLIMTTNQSIEMSQAVKSVDADGVASVVQTFDRWQLKIVSQQGVMVDYDSAANGETVGMSKALVPFLDAVVNKPISMKIDSRGEFSDTQVPQSMLDGMKNVPGMGTLLSGKTIGKLAALGTLPKEPVSMNDTWTTEADVEIPMFGRMTARSTFEYLGSVTRDGRELEKIGYTQQLSVTPGQESAAAAMKITDQSISGTTYFDNAEGHFVESDVQSHLKMEITVGKMKIESDTTTEMTMKLQSVDTAENAK